MLRHLYEGVIFVEQTRAGVIAPWPQYDRLLHEAPQPAYRCRVFPMPFRCTPVAGGR